VFLTASGLKVRKKIIREKSKIYKNLQNAIKIKNSLYYLQKQLSHEIALFLAGYDFFLLKTIIFQKFIKPIHLAKTKKRVL
jgi:hypothetical protein